MSTNLPEQQPSEEIDLLKIFKLIGNAFGHLFSFIGSVLNKFFLAFVWFVFFTKKHFIKVVIAGIIGAGLGFTKNKTEKKVYNSTAIIKQNYDTGEHLFNTVEYYNSLFQQKDSITVSKGLKISLEKSKQIAGLEMESNLTENQKLQLFNAYIQSLDSAFASTVKYKDFIKNSKDYNYSIQKITLKSFTKDNYNDVLASIIENIDSSEYFLNHKEKLINKLNSLDKVIGQSLEESQALQTVYKEVLQKPLDELPSGASTHIAIGGAKDNNVTREYELFGIDLELRREIVNNESSRKDLEKIIEIVSIQDGAAVLEHSARIFGVETSWIVSYGIKLGLVVFLGLLLLEFTKFLERYKDKI